MIAYSISLLPMIQILCKEFPDVFQSWYADDGAGMAPISRRLLLYDRLTVIRPKYDYFLKASKSILIVEPKGVERAMALTKSLSFKVTTGLRYLGGFIDEKGAQTEWIQSKVEKWVEGATQIELIATTHP